MSDDSKGVRGHAAKPKTSEGWGDPPIWSPWNFQFPSPNREGQSMSTAMRTPVRSEMKPNRWGAARSLKPTRPPLVRWSRQRLVVSRVFRTFSLG
jgi:hypothetical protein